MLRSLFGLLAGLALMLGAVPRSSLCGEGAMPWPMRPGTWRTDAIWFDGLAEKCAYEARRTIYGSERRYLATAYTNKEQVAEGSTVKLAQGTGVLCFKHHWSECVPTENYDYDFSTSCYVVAEDLAAFKLTAATQEDCGASFKQVWRAGGELRFFESVYFPDAGMRQGKIEGLDVVFEDALTLVLRDLPFEQIDGDVRLGYALSMLPSQKDTHAVTFEPLAVSVVAHPAEMLSLPVGPVRAYPVTLDREGAVLARYWFAAEGAAPWLHVLVRYAGPNGQGYELKSLERTAYWKRP